MVESTVHPPKGNSLLLTSKRSNLEQDDNTVELQTESSVSGEPVNTTETEKGE